MYKKRIIDNYLNKISKVYNAINIVGPKGCGKTTTAKQRVQTIIEFQNEEERENLLMIASTSPIQFLKNPKPILFDEWQDAPKIWGTIRKNCDDNPYDTGSYYLTGSSSAKVNTPHTGTLRIISVRMNPMSLYEMGKSNGTISLKELFDNPDSFDGCKSDMTIDDIIDVICVGGWPRCLNFDSVELQQIIPKDLFKQTYTIDISSVSKKRRNSHWAKAILQSYARNICTLAETKTLYNDVNSNYSISEPTYYEYVNALEELYIIEDIDAWCPAIRSKSNLRSGKKRNLVDPSIAVAALGLSPAYFYKDFKTLGFLFESLCIRDLKIYSQTQNGVMSYYHDRYGLEADGVLHLEDGRFALIEFKLGESQVDEGAKHLCGIERLIDEYNKKEKQCPLRKPDLKLVITGTEYGYKRDDGVFVIPIGCLKD
ncbi:MAG: DUF4143 domain-containing protein [Roseburia sp.]|nr:DUF4143 domain-containing protein [Anaeroplasma bactoclasticum]MCM1196873.1 DUF4143 domain-containing protein [Roseburia sp.]MCM1556097.1 DUF4143 domain-containing protein [Anaeroplasma bactoclasticum]